MFLLQVPEVVNPTYVLSESHVCVLTVRYRSRGSTVLHLKNLGFYASTVGKLLRRLCLLSSSAATMRSCRFGRKVARKNSSEGRGMNSLWSTLRVMAND